MTGRAYLDNAATTPVRPEVREAMIRTLEAKEGAIGDPEESSEPRR